MANITFEQIVKDVASDHGREVSEDEIGFILWNFTGFPNFFLGNVVVECARQVDEFFLGVHRCERCSQIIYINRAIPQGVMEVCDPCDRYMRENTDD